MASKPRVKVPKKAAVGEIIAIKTLISHEMESGQRKDSDGNLIPRKIINKFTADFNGTPVFWADLEPGVAANPFIEFSVKVMESGTFNFVWLDDDGTEYSSSNDIAVE